MMREIKSAFILDKSVGNRKIATIPEPGYLQSPIQKPNLMSTKTENLTCLWMCLKYIILLCDISVCYFVCVFGYVLAFEYNSQWNWMVIILRINSWIVCNIFFFECGDNCDFFWFGAENVACKLIHIKWKWFEKKSDVCVCLFFAHRIGIKFEYMNEWYWIEGGWIAWNVVNYLAKISLSSCSDTNCPKLATNSVEHGAFAASGGFGCCAPVEPTGLAKAGLGKKWPGGKPADTCIDCGCIADGCCNVIWFWKI